MTRAFSTIVLVAIGTIALGCQGGSDSVAGPSAELAGSAESATILALIEDLYPDGGLETAALKQFRNVERQYGRGQSGAAAAQAFSLIEFTLRHYDRFDDPSGAAAPTTEEGAADLVSRILAFVELAGGPIPAGAFGPDGAVVVCHAGKMCNATAGDGRASFLFPAGVTTENTVVAISPLDPMVDPFASFGVEGFPLFREFTAVPALPTDGTDNRVATVEVCTVTAPHPMAPSEEALDRIRMGRLVDGGSEVDIAPLASIPSGFDRPDCAGVNDDVPVAGAAGDAIAPSSGVTGGAVSGFSVFGAVDPEPAEDPPPPPPTDPTTTTDLVLTPPNIFDGGTLVATATVTPAPAETDAPTVTFVVNPFFNTRTAIAPVGGGEAAITVGCRTSGATVFADPQPDIVVGSGSHFIEARFPGTGTLDPSTSSMLILTCQS